MGAISEPERLTVTPDSGDSINDQFLEKIWVTYTKVHEITGEVYTGRSSGYGDPQTIVEARDARHHVNEHGFGTARLDAYSKNYAAIRGQEELLIEKNGGPQQYGGTSGNRYSGIGMGNTRRLFYLTAARDEFGET
jgi:hypothetical protein